MKCILAVCSDALSLDAATNLVSIFGVIDGISTLSFPHSLSNLGILFILQKEPTDRKGASGHVSLSFQPDGKNRDEIQKGSVPVKFDFQGKPRLRVLIRAEGITVESPGKLISRLWHKDIVIGQWEITVTKKNELPPKAPRSHRK